jgi:RTX calcium-binding nonapeptide repeat (4 copies)
MASFTVNSGTTDTAAKTVSNDDAGTILATGTLSAATAITWTGGATGQTVVIDNSGTISATTRAIDTTNSFATGNFKVQNHTTGLVTASNDAFRVNLNAANGAAFNGAVTVDNDGTIQSTGGQALDFASITSASATIDIENSGTIKALADDAIRTGAGTITITNDGLIDSTTSGSRAINLNSAAATVTSFALTNNADAMIQSQGDTVRISAGTVDGNYSIDNSGTIQSTGTGGSNGQAVDFNDLSSTLGHVTINNYATGLIQAADADAVRPGTNATINNYGHIFGNTASADGNDGIDFQANTGGVVHNLAGGLIEGTRHGITGDNPITVTNDAGATIVGHAGSGINMDTASDTTTTITNHGLITGTSNGTTDGDGVDVDGLVAIDNYGTIQATGHTPDIRAEAITIGGGTVNNFAGGVIESSERAITVDDSNLGNAFAATTIYNEGTIHGSNGEAIFITDTFADTITNKGIIEGSVAMGGGNDVFNEYTGASLTGLLDGGDGIDTLNLGGSGHGSVASVANFEVVNLNGGDWTLGSEGFTAVNFQAGAQTLRLGGDTLDDGKFDATIDGFAKGDLIDLQGIGLARDATLSADNVLTVSGRSADTVMLQLDAHAYGSGEQFKLSSDGHGGTNVSVVELNQVQGNAGNNLLVANLFSKTGSFLDGQAGNDLLVGGARGDVLNGGAGNDLVYGGAGSDKFRFNGSDVAPGHHDTDIVAGMNFTAGDSLVFLDFEAGSFASAGSAHAPTVLDTGEGAGSGAVVDSMSALVDLINGSSDISAHRALFNDLVVDITQSDGSHETINLLGEWHDYAVAMSHPDHIV